MTSISKLKDLLNFHQIDLISWTEIQNLWIKNHVTEAQK